MIPGLASLGNTLAYNTKYNFWMGSVLEVLQIDLENLLVVEPPRSNGSVFSTLSPSNPLHQLILHE